MKVSSTILLIQATFPTILMTKLFGKKIRDEYLRDSTVTILLVGLETKKRKHVDWELYSSMIDGTKNKKSGILVVNLPSTGCARVFAGHGDEEKQAVHPDILNWIQLSRTQLEDRYPYVPVRIIDNLESGRGNIYRTLEQIERG